MVPWRSNEAGEVTAQILDWYGRLADGLPGVIVVEATGIRDVPSGPLLRLSDARYISGLRKLVERVRERSAGQTRLFIQLIDFLAIRRRPERSKYLERFLELTPAHRARWQQLFPNEDSSAWSDGQFRERLLRLDDAQLAELLSAREWEDLQRGYRERVTDTHLEHIRELPRILPEKFATAAAYAREAGFDGVELHYAHAYTMASFLSKLNTREDGYGNSPAGRVRLPLEVFAAARARCGNDFTIGCRLLGDEVIEGGSRIEDASDAALALAKAGLDFLSISKGGKFEDARTPKVGEAIYPYTGPSGAECMPTVKLDARGPHGRNLHLSRRIREVLRQAGLNTPVGGAGGIDSLELAERAIQSGACDFVAAARQSLADPDWWRKIELGYADQVRRCRFTNYCEGLDQKHKQVTCQLWDRELVEPDPGTDTIAMSHDQKRRLVPPPWRPAPAP